MDKHETAKLLAVIAAAYPSFEVNQVTLDLWCQMLGDLDYQTANLATLGHIASNHFPPTVSDIRGWVVEKGPTGTEAWAAVSAAVRWMNLNEPQRAIDSIRLHGGDRAVEVAQAIGWRELVMANASDGVMRGQFLKMYEMQRQRDERQALLPPRLRLALDSKQKQIGKGDDDV